MTGSAFTLRIIIFLGSLALFLPFLGASPLFDWDEINFAECAREMITTGDYSTVQINYKSFWEKPPLFFWMQVISMKIFGINEFAARFPNALAGAITLLVLFFTGSRFFDERFGLWWVLLYAGSLLPHFYFRSGIIDPWFNLFIFSSVVCFALFLYRDRKNIRNATTNLILSGVLLGLATLTKGPVAILLFGLTFFIIALLNRLRLRLRFSHLLTFGLVVLITSFSWFALEALRGNTATIVDFVEYQFRLFNTQDAGHGGPFFYHFIVLFFGCFPAAAVAIPGMRSAHGTSAPQKGLHQWMLVLFWVVLILFSIVKTKIVHYSSLGYFPLTFLGTFGLMNIAYRPLHHWKSWYTLLYFISGLAFFIVLIALPLAGLNAEKLIGLEVIKDPFVNDALRADVQWNYWLLIPGIIYGAIILISTFLLMQRKVALAFVTMCITVIFTLFITVALFVPRVEKYSQGAVIDFYKALQGKDNVIAHPYGFKSYAHLFYTRRPPPQLTAEYPEDPLVETHPYSLFVVSRGKDFDRLQEEHPTLRHLYSKNGFDFWYRQDTGSR